MLRIKHIKIFCFIIFCSILALIVYVQMTWSKMYGGHDLDEAFCAIATSSQNFVVAGHTNSFGPEDLWVINVDSAGNIVWQKSYSGAGSGTANAITRINDGFVLTGFIL